MSSELLIGDVRQVLPTLAAESVQMCVTSPPYWGLRDYGVEGQLGLEATPEEYVANMVAVFREVRRVLAPDGTLWLNLGDKKTKYGWELLPQRCAYAIRQTHWILQEEFVWRRMSPPPVGDLRHAIRSHEYVFMLTKSRTGFYFDDTPFRAQHVEKSKTVRTLPYKGRGDESAGGRLNKSLKERKLNARGALQDTVWEHSSVSIPEAHFATFPPKLIEPCIAAGSRLGDTVLDPFFGSGTTGEVCERFGRRWLGIEINPEYGEMAKRRTAQMGLAL